MATGNGAIANGIYSKSRKSFDKKGDTFANGT